MLSLDAGRDREGMLAFRCVLEPSPTRRPAPASPVLALPVDTKGWVKYVQFVDLNGDGQLDLLGEVSGNATGVVAYINDGANRFFQLKGDALVQSGSSVEVTDMDRDGKPELVQVSSFNGNFNIAVVSLRSDRHSSHPHHCGADIDEAHEVNSPAVIACCEATEVLHSTEASLDTIAVDVSDWVMWDDDLA